MGEERLLRAAGSAATALAVSRNELAVVTGEGRLELFRLTDGAPLGGWSCGTAVTAVAASFDGTRILVGRATGQLTLLGRADGSPIATTALQGPVRKLAAHPDGAFQVVL